MLQRILSVLKKTHSSKGELLQSQGKLYPAVREAMMDVQAYAATHGGQIQLVAVSDEGEVLVRFRGACRGCPVADLTFKHGIELQLKTLVPGVKSVRRV